MRSRIGTGHRVGKDALAVGSFQRVTLERKILIEGGDARIADKHNSVVAQLFDHFNN